MRKRLWVYTLLFFVIVLAIGIQLIKKPGLPQGTQDESFFQKTGLSLSGTPSLNQPVEVTFTVMASPHVGANASIEILLNEYEQDGLELIDGDLSWSGYMAPGETVQHKVTIKAVKEGTWLIGAWAGPSWNPKYDLDNLYISVSKETGSVTKEATPCLGTKEQVESCMKI